MKNKFMIVILIALIIPIVSANGLAGLSNSTILVNKTYAQNIDFIVQIKNADAFNFYNITIDTPAFSMVMIPVLQPNQTANVTVTTSINTNYNGPIRFKGYYAANIGASNDTIPITVNYNNGPLPCSFSIVKGDKLIWTNNDTKSLDMWNTDTSNKITTIIAGGSYTQTFTSPLVFNYHFVWIGFDFGYCSVNVLSDSGYITNADFDYLPNVNVQVTYLPTTVNATFLQTSYTMNVLQSQDGLMLITNSGSETARNVTFTNSWFKFTPNNFDLDAGLSKTIAYSIIPLVSTTNQTNQSYNRIVQLTGNFPTITQNFTIFVQYADMSSSGLGYASLEDLLKKFCLDNPSLCNGGTQIVVQNNNSGSNLTQEQFRQIIEFWSTKFDAVQTELSYMKDQTNATANASTQTSLTVGNLSANVENLKNQKNDSYTFIQMLLIGSALFIIIIGGGYLIMHYRKKKVEQRLRRWS